MARNAPLTRPRPGHADLAGMQKFGHADARPVLERASARETAARVALGEVARRLLSQVLGIEILSHVVAIGATRTPDDLMPGPEDKAAIDADPVRCADPATSQAMVAEIDAVPRRTATPWAASSRCWPSGCRPGWAASPTGTGGWTAGWPAR